MRTRNSDRTPRLCFTGLSVMIAINVKNTIRSTSTLILAAIVLSMATSAPIIAKYAPDILASLADPAIAEALKQEIADPTWIDAYSGWTKNLNQTCAFGLIIIGALIIHRHLCSGMVANVLTRSIGRSAYFMSQIVTLSTLTFSILTIAVGVVWIITRLMFNDAPLLSLTTSTFTWWILTTLIITVIGLVEAITMKLGASLAAAFAMYFAITIGSVWDWGAQYTPLGLSTLINSLVSEQPVEPNIIPISASVVLILVLSISAMWVFERKDLHC